GRADSTVRVPAGSPGRCAMSELPGANRSSGESVCTSTTSSPRSPCGRTAIPTRYSAPEPLPVGVDDIHANAPPTDAADDGAQGGGGTAAAADHLAEVVGVDPDLEGAAAAGGDELHLHVVRVVDDAPDEVLESVRQDAHDSEEASEASASPFARRSLFFLGVVASVVGSSFAAASAAWKRASLSTFSGCGLRLPSAPGRPLNFCQSPVISSRWRTGSVGCAPTPSQYCARSESISIRLGSLFGWYLPIVSIARPLRRVRASATTTR